MNAYSLHIGLNKIDPKVYGNDGALNGCINDATAMESIATKLGYQTSSLIDEQATAGAVTKAIMQAAENLSSGDIFMLTYAGHGARVPDITSDEPDGYDETWCLYDRMFLDDELHYLWSVFKPGVRICVVSDSCHSGTVVRTVLLDLQREKVRRYRLLDDDLAEAVFNNLAFCYEPLKYSLRRNAVGPIQASVILLSGCMDGQLSGDGETNGYFTEHLLSVWNEGEFTGNYMSFVKTIRQSMNTPMQIPNFFQTGASNLAFEAQNPFFVGDSRAASSDSSLALNRSQTVQAVAMADAPIGAKSLREVLAADGDLRRKVQRAAVVAGYAVLNDAGYWITDEDIDEMKTDQTSIALALDLRLNNASRGDNLGEVIVAAGVGAAIAAGGF